MVQVEARHLPAWSSTSAPDQNESACQGQDIPARRTKNTRRSCGYTRKHSAATITPAAPQQPRPPTSRDSRNGSRVSCSTRDRQDGWDQRGDVGERAPRLRLAGRRTPCPHTQPGRQPSWKRAIPTDGAELTSLRPHGPHPGKRGPPQASARTAWNVGAQSFSAASELAPLGGIAGAKDQPSPCGKVKRRCSSWGSR